MRTIMITGCSSGFGKQMTETLASKGYHVIATMRNSKDRESIFSHLDIQTRQNISIYNLDVTNETEIDKLYKDLISKDVCIDILINNAGYGMFGALEELSTEKIRHQMEVNFFGLVKMIQVFLPMLRISKGKIINISSLMGEFSLPFGSVYSASKHAVEGLTEGLIYELKPFGVQVSCVLPGSHRTGFIDAISWTDEASDSSIYSNHKKSMERMMAEVNSGRFTPDSSRMTDLILKIIHAKQASRRYYLGADSIFGHFARRIFPDFIYYPVLHFLMSRYLSK